MKPLKLRHNSWKDDYNPLPRNLKYGKTYCLAFAGVTESITFTLKKRTKIRCEWIDGAVTYEDFKWVRKLVNDPNCIHFLCEIESENE